MDLIGQPDDSNNAGSTNAATSSGAGAAGGGSPRRKNPPLDIDKALYLQSQASYVQEPNLVGKQKQLEIRKQKQVAFSFSQQHQQQAHLNPNSYTNDWCPGSRYFPLVAGANISVDYIDCLSNNDLILGQASQQQQQQQHQQHQSNPNQPQDMRLGIPSCRKHLRHFNRNRVEPQPAATVAGDQRQQQPPPPQQLSIDQPDNTSSSLVTDEPDSFSDPTCSSSNYTSEQNNPGQQQQQQPASVLYPILVKDVKKRTYLIGSVGQDSLLGEEELHRYFPTGRVQIFVCTWNQNRKRAPANLNDLLLPDQLGQLPDIYAVGIQEAFSYQQDYLRDWEVELQTTLGPNHVLLHSCSLGVLHLALFVRRDLIWFCSQPEESAYNSRSMPTNMIKTKGAVSIAFRFFGTSFMFTNCHFPAHENRLRDRIDEYQRIINSIDLPKNLKLLKPRYLSQDSTARFDCVFFMGDLNFRLEQRTFDETITILEDIFHQREPTYEALTQNDELLKVMETDQAFHGFDEAQIRFPPTYKFLAQTNKYDRQTKRVPSYTDRILFRSKRQRHIRCLVYDWLPQLLSSDHKPVYCLFDVLVRPGHEQNLVGSLNAGLFQRAVYLEALKRRAEDPNGLRENGASGNLICSIS